MLVASPDTVVERDMQRTLLLLGVAQLLLVLVVALTLLVELAALGAISYSGSLLALNVGNLVLALYLAITCVCPRALVAGAVVASSALVLVVDSFALWLAASNILDTLSSLDFFALLYILYALVFWFFAGGMLFAAAEHMCQYRERASDDTDATSSSSPERGSAALPPKPLANPYTASSSQTSAVVAEKTPVILGAYGLRRRHD